MSLLFLVWEQVIKPCSTIKWDQTHQWETSKWKLRVSNSFTKLFHPFSALTLLVGRQEGHPACKNVWVTIGDDLTGAFVCHTAPAVITIFIILSSSKITEWRRSAAAAKPGCPGKWPSDEHHHRTKRFHETVRQCIIYISTVINNRVHNGMYTLEHGCQLTMHQRKNKIEN